MDVLHPASLPPGTRVGDWRVVSWRGRGTFGAVYRAVRIGEEQAEPVALKLALHPQEPRFEREAALLSRLHHPHVPALHARGEWRQADCVYPYLVMQWVEGSSLYDWAAVRNPSNRQVLRLLAQLARALEATHAIGGVHRDVKGANTLVRTDGHAFLMDFGAGTHPGASLLTFEPLPPGTAAYRSPEAWAFAHRFGHQPGVHYPAQPADDLFALGVAAYRLVTDEHPPPTDPRAEESVRWYVARGGIPSPRALNPRVDPHLGKHIMRMLSLRATERGTMREMAEKLEQRAERAGRGADQPLFAWETLEPTAWSPEERAAASGRGHRPRYRLKGGVRAARRARALTRYRAWLLGLLGGAVGLGLALLLGVWGGAAVHSPPEAAPGEAVAAAQPPGRGARSEDGGTTELAREVLTAPEKIPEHLSRTGPGIRVDLPQKPLPGQRRPDSRGKCRYRRETVINGGCWVESVGVKPPCDQDEYEWRGRCYLPAYPDPKPPTSGPP